MMRRIYKPAMLRAASAVAARAHLQVEIFGAPLSAGQLLQGVASGPAALRAAGLLRQVEALGLLATDCGDVCAAAPPPAAEPPPAAGGIRHSAFLAGASQSIAAAVTASLRAGRLALLLGGDHSVGLGSIAGALRANPDTRVLWVDARAWPRAPQRLAPAPCARPAGPSSQTPTSLCAADADVNTPATSPSANFHGMPVAFLTRHVEPAALGPEWAWLRDTPPLQPSRIAYVGLRDVDAGEREALARLGIASFTMSDVDRLGIGAVMKKALKLLGGGKAPLHLSFDVDACDPAWAPSTGTAVPGGLTFREAHFLCEAVAASGALRSMDMVEVNPAVCGGGQTATAAAAVGLIASALGKTVL
jgi:arginase